MKDHNDDNENGMELVEAQIADAQARMDELASVDPQVLGTLGATTAEDLNLELNRLIQLIDEDEFSKVLAELEGNGHTIETSLYSFVLACAVVAPKLSPQVRDRAGNIKCRAAYHLPEDLDQSTLSRALMRVGDTMLKLTCTEYDDDGGATWWYWEAITSAQWADDAELLFMLGGRLERGCDLYLEEWELSPHFVRAQACELMGENYAAEHFYRRAVESWPDEFYWVRKCLGEAHRVAKSRAGASAEGPSPPQQEGDS